MKEKLSGTAILRRIFFGAGCIMAVLTVAAWNLRPEVSVYFFFLTALLIIAATIIPKDFFFRTYVLIEAAGAVPKQWRKRVSEKKKEDSSLRYLDEDTADIVNLPKESKEALLQTSWMSQAEKFNRTRRN